MMENSWRDLPLGNCARRLHFTAATTRLTLPAERLGVAHHRRAYRSDVRHRSRGRGNVPDVRGRPGTRKARGAAPRCAAVVPDLLPSRPAFDERPAHGDDRRDGRHSASKIRHGLYDMPTSALVTQRISKSGRNAGMLAPAGQKS